mmetsp:Transcript_23325/g.68590  ORF Transcript_23325/g.68590 Transcript_23325/m.68590 type:complete len:366 (-) Transcript_23325:70-1167(-)
MVGRDDEEGVRVCQKLGEDQVHQRGRRCGVGGGERLGTAGQHAARGKGGGGGGGGSGQEEEARGEEGAEHAHEELDVAEEERGGAEEEVPVSDHAWVLLQLRRELLEARVRLAAHPVEREHLEGVWRVVEPLPSHRQEGDDEVLDWREEGRHLAQVVEVPLDKVGVGVLAEGVVVQLVVLDVPRLGQHPVEPVHSAPLHGPECEAERGEASGAIVLLVVAAVAGVVRNHRPPGHGPQRQAHHGDEVGLHPHGGDADGAAEVGPEDHALQVLDVRLALPFLEPAAQLAALLAKGGEVNARDPLVLGRHCGRRSRGIRLLQRRSRGDGRMQPAKQRRGVHGRSSGCRDARTHERRRRAQRGRRRRQA